MSFIGGYALRGGDESSSQLQSTIAGATSGIGRDVIPHHPITCAKPLTFDEEGVFACPHAEMPADDPRTHACLVHSLALLVIELGMSFSGLKELPNHG